MLASRQPAASLQEVPSVWQSGYGTEIVAARDLGIRRLGDRCPIVATGGRAYSEHNDPGRRAPDHCAAKG